MEREIIDWPGAFNSWLGQQILGHLSAVTWLWHGVGLLLVLLAFAEAWRPLPRFPRSLHAVLGSDWFFLGVVAVSTVVLRVPLLSVLHELNPDESQWVVGAATLVQDWRFWHSVDCTSSGPLNVLPLALIHVCGGALNYGTVRLWATLACILPTFVLVHRALRQSLDQVTSRLLLMPLVMLFALPTYPDFAAYNSEHVPMLLTAAVMLLAGKLVAGQRATVALPMALGLLLGCFPYAKLQAIPLGIACGVVVLGALLLRRSWAAAVALAGAAVVPTLLVLLALWSYDGFEPFWHSYVVSNLRYGSSGGFAESVRGSALQKLPVLWSTIGLCQEHFLAMLALVLSSLGIFAWRAARGQVSPGVCATGIARAGAAPLDPASPGRISTSHPNSPAIRPSEPGSTFATLSRRLPWRRLLVPDGRSLLSWAVLLAAVYGVVKPGNDFPHYLLLLAVPTVLACSHLVGALTGSGRSAWLRAAFAGATVLLPWLAAISNGALGIHVTGESQEEHARIRVAKEVRALVGANAKIAVWGWESRLYVYARCIQATRESHSYYQITDPEQHEYYMNRYLGDLERNRPQVLVDTVGEKAYCFTAPEYRADRFPGIREYVAKNYRLLAEIEGMRIYQIQPH